jgi:hypothetical protein
VVLHEVHDVNEIDFSFKAKFTVYFAARSHHPQSIHHVPGPTRLLTYLRRCIECPYTPTPRVYFCRLRVCSYTLTSASFTSAASYRGLIVGEQSLDQL